MTLYNGLRNLLSLIFVAIGQDSDVQTLTDSAHFQTGAQLGEQSVERAATWYQQGGMTERIAGGVMAIAIVAIVLNELFTLQLVNNTTGPFSGLIDSVENVGTAALTLVVLGFLAAAGGAVLTMFRGGF